MSLLISTRLLPSLDAFDGEGDQRFAVAAIRVAMDALGHFHSAQAGAILFRAPASGRLPCGPE